MRGISAAQGLRVLDLSNNSIVCIEGIVFMESNLFGGNQNQIMWSNLNSSPNKLIYSPNLKVIFHAYLPDGWIEILNFKMLTVYIVHECDACLFWRQSPKRQLHVDNLVTSICKEILRLFKKRWFIKAFIFFWNYDFQITL